MTSTHHECPSAHSPLWSHIPLFLQGGSDKSFDRALYKLAHPAEGFSAASWASKVHSACAALASRLLEAPSTCLQQSGLSITGCQTGCLTLWCECSTLGEVLPKVLKDVKPDLVLYDAGVDPHINDALGRLALTSDGLFRRDMQVGLAILLAGVHADGARMNCLTWPRLLFACKLLQDSAAPSITCHYAPLTPSGEDGQRIAGSANSMSMTIQQHTSFAILGLADGLNLGD